MPAEAISKLQYNGGSLLEDELLDAGEAEGANYATPYRRYDPAIGRLLGVDPLADQYADQGTGNFAGNDPVNQNDPTGAFISDTDASARGRDRLVMDTGRYGQFDPGGGGGSGGGGGRSLNAAGFARLEAMENQRFFGRMVQEISNRMPQLGKVGWDSRHNAVGFYSGFGGTEGTAQDNNASGYSGVGAVVGSAFHAIGSTLEAYDKDTNDML